VTARHHAGGDRPGDGRARCAPAGEHAAARHPRRPRTPSRCSRCAASSSTARAARRSSRASIFALRGGEILGIAGVEGNGQTELIEALAGLRPVAGGSILLGGNDITLARCAGARGQGPRAYPRGPPRRGLILDYTLAENLVLGRQDLFSKRGCSTAPHGDSAAEQIAAFDVRPTDPALPARALSRRQQQKIVIAREMGHGFRVLLAAQPTRGVDVGAIEFIHASCARRGRRQGDPAGLSELTEVLALADRVAVLFRGRIVALLPRSEASAEVLGPYMTGRHWTGAAA
jgi:simple sugar transport system ATP-binding protein